MDSKSKLNSIPKFLLVVLLIIGTLLIVNAINADKEIDKKSMVNKLKKIADLATVELKLRKIIFAKQKKEFLGIGLGTAIFVAWIEPKIKAGIDLEQISPNDVAIDETNKNIKVTLPPIKIISYDYNEEDIKVNPHLTTDAVFNRFDLEDIEIIHRNMDRDIRTYLNFLGIKEEGEKSMRKFFLQYFENLGYSGDITFKENNQPLMYFDLEREYPEKEK